MVARRRVWYNLPDVLVIPHKVSASGVGFRPKLLPLPVGRGGATHLRRAGVGKMLNKKTPRNMHKLLSASPALTALVLMLLSLICAPAFAQAAPAPASSPPASSTQQISVLVNGQPVAFSGAPPQEIHDAVMVPLRGVLTQMGASVSYDQPTHTVHVQEGTTAISLPIGSATATVNGKPQILSQPAVAIAGTTLVPLRFVSEALGAYVEWNAATETVRIVTPSAHLSTLPAPPASLGPTFIGQVLGVYTNTNPEQISVRVGAGEATVLPVSPSATVSVLNFGEPASPTTLGALQTGDQVRITRDSAGQAVAAQAIFGRVFGVIAKMTANPDGSHAILLNDGISVQLVAGAPVTMSGRRVGIAEVMESERVVIRTGPDNKTGYGMAVVTANNSNPTPPG